MPQLWPSRPGARPLSQAMVWRAAGVAASKLAPGMPTSTTQPPAGSDAGSDGGPTVEAVSPR